jgi:NADPH-dependent 2,4-dienoyl-CoA reductase/sulfur reductase-like enzyme
MSRVDLLVAGAGPAGMAAAVVARRYGLSVMVIDEQPTPGGQIWRSIEQDDSRDAILGPAYVDGRVAAAAFRQSGSCYRPGAKLWQVEGGFRAFLSEGREASVVFADNILLATGAQERPVPFPGWTLPGVLTVGAAQILLKSAGEVPDAPVWIAGTGPLPLLYAIQLLKAGGEIAGFLDTTPRGQWAAALRHLPHALLAASDLIKGIGWTARLRLSKAPVITGVVEVEAVGQDRLEQVRYRLAPGNAVTVPASVLLVHEGVVPSIHPALSLDCKMAWNASQDCFSPVLDEWGESSRARVFVAGDAAGIGGARVAQLSGELVALRVVERHGAITADASLAAATLIRRKLRKELAARPFLDAMFRPRASVFSPIDDTIVCRCEGISAGEIRRLACSSKMGPNQIKAATRTGMGPCQGRQCGYTLTRLVSEVQGRSPEDVGYLHIRPPLKPVTLGELASLRGGS